MGSITGMLNQERIMQNIAPIKRMMNMVQTASNPQAMLNQMLQNNPQYKQIINAINANGGNLQKAFYQMAKEKGVDPNTILNQLR